MIPVNGKSTTKQPVILSEEQFIQISKLINALRGKLNSRLVLFGDMDGQLIAKSGEIPGLDATIFSALTAGDFSATREMARMLGGQNTFKLHYHEGIQQHLYVAAVGEHFFVSVIFDPSVTLGMVRIFIKKTLEKIQEVIDSASQEEAQVGQLIDSEFKSLVRDDLNKILG
jgi:predicted regulator of Ras-like GTPase activity (Roadblock/LC7/MglB family)